MLESIALSVRGPTLEPTSQSITEKVKYLKWPYIHNIGIQMKRKELTTTFDFKLKKPFDLHGLYKNISKLSRLSNQVDYFYI